MTDNSRVRVTIVGVIVVALFGALIARLWFLEVGSGTTFEVRAEQRAARVLQTESPRGQILDAAGKPLVTNRVVWSLTMDRRVPGRTRVAVFGRLAELLGGRNTPTSLEKRFSDPRQSPLRPALLVVNTPEAARITILEHRESFPGVAVNQQTVRAYPDGQLAAQVLGYVGDVNSDELKKLHGYVSGDEIGRAGIESAYESVLRGKPRRDKYQVDPSGQPVGDPVQTSPGTVGDNVQLSIDAGVQKVAEASLAQAVVEARSRQDKSVKTHYATFAAPAGAVVALDAHTGGVVAMASYPTYHPSEFIGGITQDEWNKLNDPNGYYPLTNRATQGLYAPGSTFKLVTSVAANTYGVYPWGQWFHDPGYIVIGADKQRLQDANGEVPGNVDLQRAITVSSDVYFYNVGDSFWNIWNAGDKAAGDGIQTTARELGFGSKTGIELDESQGRVPDAAWKAKFAKILYPHDATKQQQNSQWFPGDNVNLAVGQGDLVVTPLQLADAYAAFANGGDLLQPHVAEAVQDAKGKIVERIGTKVVRHINFDPGTYAAMMRGFQGVVNSSSPKGTAYDAFKGALISVAGKTGTAQVNGKGDTSLFVGMVPADNPQYVVVAVVEQAGFGSEVAAPVARQVMEQLMHVPVGPLQINTTKTAD